MKELLLSSTLPYWFVFGLVTAAGILAFMGMRKESISKLSIQLVTILAHLFCTGRQQYLVVHRE